MTLLCCCLPVKPPSISLSDIANLSQVLIALVNLFLAGYILTYQIKKDKKADNATARLNEQNIKLQWFKELIVQPNMDAIALFYSNLHTIKDKINSSTLSDDKKLEINDFAKKELTILRKSFVDVLQLVDRHFSDQLLFNLDGLIDEITNAIFEENINLRNLVDYEKHIGTKISYSKNNLIAQLYNYKGLS